MVISGYNISEELYESANSLVYRAQKGTDKKPVILKMLKHAYPPPEKIAWFRREYDLTRNLSLPGVIDAYSLETDQNRPVMVLEDFGGESLNRLKIAGELPLIDFLNLAIEVTDVLGQVHRKNIIHKDINQSNIVFNPTTDQVKIIDFGISTVLSRETTTVRNPNVLEGTLAYMSPEQTGRMNRALDYRTDFYSLGATFYELLTGQTPFPTTNVMELVHCHIARQSFPPHELNPDIPRAISDIVMRLLAKNAEDRYQSAYGLKADLEECQRQLQATGRIEPFSLGQNDVSDRFQIPQKLYGREREIGNLLAAFERVSQGASEMMLVSGYAGIGKSALVQEIYKPITQQRGYFISGKFDQFQRNIPYAAPIQAFSSLIRQLLTESETQIEEWRKKLLEALGPNGQVIIDVIPEVELITGPQPEVPALAPTEAQNRFQLVFGNFIKVFTQPEHPIVLFLDDFQWADGASLNLLQLLMTAAESRYLFLIGAYRDNEVSPAHPLMLTLDELKKEGSIINNISLSPLDLPNITQFISDALNCPLEKAVALAELVEGKTGGNPFFMIEFMKSLYTEKLLEFDFGSRGWGWDLGQIQGQDITNNVVELMADKVQKLPSETQGILKLAACIGNRFDLATLAVVSEKSPVETAADLWSGMVEGLVLPLSDVYKLVELDIPDLADGLEVQYKFSHDRIQQAVYSLIPEEDRQAVHRQVGQLLLRNTPEEEREEKIFDIVNQLNQGINLIEGQSERDELAQLNLIAGKKAKTSAAYEPAFNYLQVGMGLVGEDGWQRKYDLTLKLYTEGAEAEFLSTDFEEMERLAEVVLGQARTLLDKMKVYEVKLQAYAAQNKPLEAVKTALPVLQLLGVRLSEKPNKLHILLGLLGTKFALRGKRIEKLIKLPEMTDPYKLATMGMLSNTLQGAYVTASELLPLVVFKMVNLSIKHGNYSESAVAYAMYGLILCGVVGDIDAGYRSGQLALSLLERLNAKERKGRTSFIFNYTVRHWKEHLRETLKPLLEAYQSALETGDLEFAANAAHIYSKCSFYIGKELAGLEREMAKYSEATSQLKQEMSFYHNEQYRQVVLNLMGRAEDPCRLSGESYDEEKMLPLHREANDRYTTFSLYFLKLNLCYLFQSYPQAVENAAMAEKYLDGVTGSIDVPLFHFYDSLSRLAVFPDAQRSEQRRILKKVAANQKKIKKWVHHAPMNHLHKFYTVEAERARVLGKDGEAREYYDQAIVLARENEYLNEEALAHELAAKFYLAKGQDHLAHHYLRDAHYAYQRWGAIAKVKDLETRYPQVFAQTAASTLPATATTSTTTDTEQRVSTALDLTSMIKASQAISSEIVLDKLLATLMKIVIENGGAQKGYLILEKGGGWVVEAEGIVDRDDVTVLQSIPVEEQSLPMSIVSYVARTKENVVLDDATNEGSFTQDPYIKAKGPYSVLCAPLINQGKLTGMLYLENNLTTGAFTQDRLTLLNLFTSQAAISIENAQAYETITRKVNELSSLHTIGTAITSILDMDNLLDTVLKTVVYNLGYDRAIIMLVDEERGVLSNGKIIGGTEEMNKLIENWQPPISEDAGVLAQVVISGEPILVSDINRTDIEMNMDLVKALKTESFLAVPLKTKEKVIGVIAVDNFKSGVKLTENDRNLLSTLAGQVAISIDNARLVEEVAQRERIRQELEVARNIQLSLLPQDDPQTPGFEIVGKSIPADEVGGDFYSYHQMDGEKLGIAIGDVSGKGISAAMFMAVISGIIDSEAKKNDSVSGLIKSVNQLLIPRAKPSKMNSALLYTIIDSKEKTLKVANAGEIAPIVCRGDGSECDYMDVKGFPIGMTTIGKYVEKELELGSGDTVVLSSDGIVEAMDGRREMFGFDRLRDMVYQNKDLPAPDLTEKILDEVRDFVGSETSQDDITIVVLKAL